MMRNGWSDLAVEIDRTSAVPIYRQIVERLRELILTGALPEGTRLPPERSLAAVLTVNRSTVVHAYRDLAVSGLIDQRVGSGSRVAVLEPDHPERSAVVPWWQTLPPWRSGRPPALLEELAAVERRDRIAFVAGIPPPDPSPHGDLGRSFARVAENHRAVAGYGESEGYPPLREAIAERLRFRGVRSTAADVLVLTGSTQGIALVAQALAEPGDEIVVEAPTYPGALQIFAVQGLRAVAVPVDESGLRVDHLEAVLSARRPRFIYTMPALHNPTGVTLSEARRERLIALAARAGVPIVEDDPYGDLAPAHSTPLVARNPAGVIHLGSFSKTIAPSLRLGYACAPRTIYERLRLRKQAGDLATSMYVQAAVRDYLLTVYDAHLPRLRAELEARRAVALDAVDTYWPASMHIVRNGSGFYLWVTAPDGVRASALLEAAERRGASFLCGEPFFAPPGGERNFRLAITPMPAAAIAEGIRRIGSALG
ncbi:MAG: PLP-dependent aminotransferase family protein [Candidatus Velthaea sp.]|jgi:DNA-binding transcriptional MocR family regulator